MQPAGRSSRPAPASPLARKARTGPVYTNENVITGRRGRWLRPCVGIKYKRLTILMAGIAWG